MIAPTLARELRVTGVSAFREAAAAELIPTAELPELGGEASMPSSRVATISRNLTLTSEQASKRREFVNGLVRRGP